MSLPTNTTPGTVADPLQLLLDDLNPEQLTAATHLPHSRLQVVAGPGTGKTKLITLRVAYLLLQHHLSPHEVVVTTFTTKAAREMQRRLEHIARSAGGDAPAFDASRLFIGTFHSVCLKFLRKHGRLVGLALLFTVADTRDTAAVVRQAVERLRRDKSIPDRPPGGDKKLLKLLSLQISSLKSRAVTPTEYAESSGHDRTLARVYQAYEVQMETNGMVDFDDLLLRCHRLLTQHPHVARFVKHVLVDEFQDTLLIQLRLVRLLAGVPQTHAQGDTQLTLLEQVWADRGQFCGNVTVVGDPNQSIYGFRDALLSGENFRLMQSAKDGYYDDVLVVALERNYRSTKAILGLSNRVLQEGRSDEPVQLTTSLVSLFAPVYYRDAATDGEEALWVANQIGFLAHSFPPESSNDRDTRPLPTPPSSAHRSPPLVEYSSMAVLVRSAHQTRAVENALVKHGIPYEMVKGRAFWERKEVTEMLDYLRVVLALSMGWLHPTSFLRTVNVPVRGIGPKSLASLEQFLVSGLVEGELEPTERMLQQLRQGIDSGAIAGLSAALVKNIRNYLQMMDNACALLLRLHDERAAVLQVFDMLYEQLGLQLYYTENGSLDQEQHMNIAEIRHQLEVFDAVAEADLFEDDGVVQVPFLQNFITLLSIYTAGEVVEGDTHAPSKVAISTIHAAKGLEWDVVFVPNLVEGVLPSRWATQAAAPTSTPATFQLARPAVASDELEEERRIFYVALTRAKVLLYLSRHRSADSGFGGFGQIKEPSQFLLLAVTGLSQPSQPAFGSAAAVLDLWRHLGYDKRWASAHPAATEQQRQETVQRFVDRFANYRRLLELQSPTRPTPAIERADRTERAVPHQPRFAPQLASTPQPANETAPKRPPTTELLPAPRPRKRLGMGRPRPARRP